MSDYMLRAARAEEGDVRAIYGLLLRMFEESELQALNPIKAMVEIHRVCAEEAAWIVDKDGAVVASIGMAEAQFWYSDDPILATRWLYALPEHRGHDGAFGMMMEEVKALGEATGMVSWVDIFNPAKTRRIGRLDAAFQRFSFDPRGLRMRIIPAVKEVEIA